MGRAKRLGHTQSNKGRMKGDDPEIDTAQTPKRLDRRLAFLEKIRKTFTNSIRNNYAIWRSVLPSMEKFELTSFHRVFL